MMKKFRRRFCTDALKGHTDKSRSLIKVLFERWSLPGQTPAPQTPAAPLRLALRDGYVNFYANGQSVAKLSTPNGRPRIEVASKYLANAPGDFRPCRDDGGVACIEGEALFGRDAPQLLDHIVRRSQDHCQDEKRFVEHLLAANPGIIEVEMALPGDDQLVSCIAKRQGKRIAPRIDLVVVHVLADGQPLIDFWEAKLAHNGELRATLPGNGGTKEPHLCYQLADYTAWMRLPHRTEEVRTAFQDAGRELDRLAQLAGKQGEARELWRMIAARPPKLNPVPGIIIGNYDPRCPSDTRLRAAASFRANGHRDRLETQPTGQLRFTVREVESQACPNRLIDIPLRGVRI